MFCSNCGKEIQQNWKFCPNCGGQNSLAYKKSIIKNVQGGATICDTRKGASGNDIDHNSDDLYEQSINNSNRKMENVNDESNGCAIHETVVNPCTLNEMLIRNISDTLYIFYGKSTFEVKVELGGKRYQIINPPNNVIAVIECRQQNVAYIQYCGKRLLADTSFSLKGAYYRIEGKDWKTYSKVGGLKHVITHEKEQLAEFKKNIWTKDIRVKCNQDIDELYLIMTVFTVEAMCQYSYEHSNDSTTKFKEKNKYDNKRERSKEDKKKDASVKKKRKRSWIEAEGSYHEDFSWDEDSHRKDFSWDEDSHREDFSGDEDD